MQQKYYMSYSALNDCHNEEKNNEKENDLINKLISIKSLHNPESIYFYKTNFYQRQYGKDICKFILLLIIIINNLP